MKTLTFRFYDALAAKKDGKKLSWIDCMILLRSKLTHAELQFDVDRGGVSFSSTMADKANGCRFKFISYTHPLRWRSVSIDIKDEQEEAIWVWACDMAGMMSTWPYKLPAYLIQHKGCEIIYQGESHKKYDAPGLLSFALRKSSKWWLNIIRGGVWCWTAVVKPDPDKVWCSEACAIVWNCGGIKQIFPTEISPEELYRKVA